MRKNISFRAVCLIAAIAVLGGIAAYAAVAGSPYEILKNALLDALTYHNGTQEIDAVMTVNGEPYERSKQRTVNGDNGYLTYDYDENGEVSDYSYHADGLSVYPRYAADGGEWYAANVSVRNGAYVPRGGVAVFTEEARSSSQVRFIELLADTLIGDLKNNVTMTSSGGTRLISGTLTESQVPELAKAALDMLIEQTGAYASSRRDISFDGTTYVFEQSDIQRGTKTVTTYRQAVRAMTAEEKTAYYDGAFYEKYANGNGDTDFYGFRELDGVSYLNLGPYEYVSSYTAPAVRADYESTDPLALPMKGLVINYVHGEAEVDENGGLLTVSVSGTATVTDIFGQSSELGLSFGGRISDVGVSNPVCPVSGAEQLLTAEYLNSRFGSEYGSVYFTANPDGSINENSVTTTYPGETAKTTLTQDTVTAA